MHLRQRCREIIAKIVKIQPARCQPMLRFFRRNQIVLVAKRFGRGVESVIVEFEIECFARLSAAEFLVRNASQGAQLATK